MSSLRQIACVGVVAGVCAAASAQHATKMIPREVLFGNPDKAAVRLSPDGTQISFLSSVDGVLNVWVGPIGDPGAAEAITADKDRGISTYYWAYDSEHVLYTQDKGGDENFHVYSVNVETKEELDLTPFEEIIGPDGEPVRWPDGRVARPRAGIESVSQKFPHEILVGINKRDAQLFDIYRVNIHNGAMEMVQENPGFAGFTIDDDYNIRFASQFLPTGGAVIHEKMDSGEFEKTDEIPQEDAMTTSPAGFDKTGRILYMIDSRGRDTAALKAVDLDTGEKRTIASDDKADIGGVLAHPTEKTIQAYSANYLRNEWVVIDPAIAGDLKYLRTVDDGEILVTSRTLDDSKWSVAYVRDNGPVRYFMYDRDAHKAKFLFTNRSSLEGVELATMHPSLVKTRDGLDMVCYLTLPVGTDTDNDAQPDEPLPTVLLVHGGPWARDSWGYNSMHQWLANRGYAVLSVNFRGSTGFGKNFINASNLEWAGTMHDDLIDAVDWAIEGKVADPDRVAIMGGSYGGYATLVGLTFTPDKFACGVDIVGPSNLVTLLNSIPPYWGPMRSIFTTRMGDDQTEEGRALLESRSPLNFVDNITKPLLIGQGANDPRVKQAEADQIAAAMTAKNIPVTYVLYPDEGHGFRRPENRKSFNAVTESFLAEHLGGRYQPIDNDFEGSSIEVPEGAEHVHGLKDAIDN